MASTSGVGTLPTRPPKYCRQRGQGRADRAYVRIGGKKIILGKYGSAQSKQRYAELIGNPQAPPPEPAGEATVAMVMAGYLEHAKVYYRTPDGKPGREYELIREVLRFVRKNCSDLPAKDFGPKRLKETRHAMIEADHSRKYINKNVDRIRRMFRWATAEELVPASVHQALSAVVGLKRGRCEARETEPVQPVSDADVEATLPHLPQVIADMVKLQRVSAMRAGELVQMRPCDIDRTGEVWLYRPPTHKTQYRGRERIVMLGPKAQAILLPYLARGAEMHLFRPVDSEAKRQAEREANRKTAPSCGNRRGTNRVEQPKKEPGEAYTTASYRRAIDRASKLAKVPSWSPHRLRHAAATEIRSAFGLEEAQIILGHASADISQVYAQRDLQKGLQVAKLIG